MKRLAYIFCFYLLAITCLPCADSDSNKKEANPLTVVQSQGQDDHHDEGDEHCSPFCHCSCCQTVCVAKIAKLTVTDCFKEIENKKQLTVSPLQDNFSSI